MKQINTASTNGISLSCTQGAPLATPALGRFPSNTATLVGDPGTSIYASVSYPAVFDKGDQPDAFVTLDRSGRAVLRFRSDALASDKPIDADLRAVSMAAYPEYRPDQLVSATVIFGNYRIAAQPNIWCYGYATGAVADGVSPCSIYVVLDKEINKPLKTFNLSLDNGARVAGAAPVASPEPGTTVYSIPFSSNGFGAADIVCDVPATVRGVVTLPDTNDGDIVVVKLMFLARPGA
ncbi:MAG: hypothetical protein ACN6O8_06105 [Achromobacter sp.]|uniref:hypothetical protein n=1 Tax=Achromobacter sp. TaxID=134375 RepID=UPI003CFFEAA5